MNNIKAEMSSLESLPIKKNLKSIESVFNPGTLTTFVNPMFFCISRKSPYYIDLLSNFDHIFCDGFLFSALLSRIFGQQYERISFDGNSLAIPAFDYINDNELSVAIIGGTKGDVLRSEPIFRSYLGRNLAFVHHGYINENDVLLLCSDISHLNVDVVIVGAGAPKQEDVVCLMREKLPEISFITCGGYVSQVAIKSSLFYYPESVNRFNLRFLYRIRKEGFRIFKRYALDYRHFFAFAVKSFFYKRP